MNKIFLWSITVALAGFLFGFDTVVISGVDKKLQVLWHTSDIFHRSVVMAVALWGTVTGAICGSIPTNTFGRKKTLIWIGVLFLVSAIGSSLANGPWTFVFFRFLGGLGIGVSTIAAPAYVSEIAPAKDRGRLVSFYQFNIVLGILLAFLSNYLLRDVGENAWRWMVGVKTLLALFYTIIVFSIPESPRWLLSKSRIAEAKIVLEKINPKAKIEDLMKDMQIGESIEQIGETIFLKKYRFPLILAFLIALFNQFSGISAFLYYVPRIFAETKESATLISSIGIALTNLVFTLFGVCLIDILGRKILMFIGSVGYIISFGLVSAAFFMKWEGITVAIFLFIASHAIGQGAVIWVFISEIFPNHLRASGQAFGSSIHWVLAAVIPSMIPFLFPAIDAGAVFLILAIVMVFQLLFVIFIMPETKGISLEELQETVFKQK